jgi:hypothetical protein
LNGNPETLSVKWCNNLGTRSTTFKEDLAAVDVPAFEQKVWSGDAPTAHPGNGW